MLLDKESGRASDLLATIKVVSFAPSDVELVRESGRVRRRYLDLLGCQLSAEYLHQLRDYQRALKQRNETLARSFVFSHGRAAAAAAREPWTERVIALGADLATRRAALMEKVAGALAGLTTGAFPGAGALRAEYAPGVPWTDGEEASEALSLAIEAGAARDEAQGYTTAGPHTDDVDLELDGRDLRRFGSLGQQQLAAMFLKLAQADLVRTTTGATPILLVDEMFAVLDRAAAEEFLRQVQGEGQIFLATAQEGWLGELRARGFRVRHVSAGAAAAGDASGDAARVSSGPAATPPDAPRREEDET
jgi:DNA replication and repair protein RecF